MHDSPSNQSAIVPFDTFTGLDIRVGRIVSVEDFEKARLPAYKLTVDFGFVGQLQTSAQVTRYSVDELRGRLVIGVINVGTKRVAGFVSEFLVLAALDRDNIPHLLAPDAGAQPGDRIA